MSTVLVWVGVCALGGLGAVCRLTVDKAISRRTSGSFPYGTLAVNTSGALLLGFLAGLALPPHLALLAGTGFVGSYTTFSTWMFEAQRLGEDGAFAVMWLYLLGSMVAGLAATGAGWLLGGALG